MPYTEVSRAQFGILHALRRTAKLWLNLRRDDIVPIITIHRIAGGRIVEDWVLVGSLLLFQQLGMVPATQTLVARATT